MKQTSRHTQRDAGRKAEKQASRKAKIQAGRQAGRQAGSEWRRRIGREVRGRRASRLIKSRDRQRKTGRSTERQWDKKDWCRQKKINICKEREKFRTIYHLFPPAFLPSYIFLDKNTKTGKSVSVHRQGERNFNE